MDNLSIRVKYLDSEMPKLAKLDQGDWIDLVSTKEILLKKDEHILIPLGVVIELPQGYEAYITPRSSTFKKFGILQPNSPGIVDESYRGPNDQWMMSALATREVVIPRYERICQFRIQKKMDTLTIEEISEVKNENRGGFGSTDK